MSDWKFGSISSILTDYASIVYIIIALWGGVVSYIEKIRRSKSHFRTWALIAELVIAGFTGAIAMFVGLELQLNQEIIAVLVGVLAHMGARSISTIETWVLKRLGIDQDK